MSRAERFREIIVGRAGGACEYCRLLEEGTGVTFHLDHVIPPGAGGKTTLDNLALSCPGCNLAKGNQTEGLDSAGRRQPLYNQRLHDPSYLGWFLHFVVDLDTGVIQGATAVGEATITLLQINAPSRVYARRLQLLAGLWG
ncbi:MAG: HNH endonuclease [Armatimonadetes bacterium]|nr:HNH endonuclease [Armatimonadota bacterium]PJB74245.1 MAG: HNH endonuclease [Armatimonadetes bacterium CG_4_9_14_3_um_filter_58_7]